MNILPSKRVLIVAVFILVIGLFFAYFRWNSNKDIQPTKGNEPFTLKNNSFEVDSDGDGLADWEEVLWQTDKNNPDTDGDGTLDGEEVKEGRNPLLAGPDDALKSAVGSSTELGSFSQNTKTEQMAKQFFSDFVKLYYSGSLTKQTKEELARAYALQLTKPEPIADKYSLSDINIINDNRSAVLKRYGNEAADIVSKYSVYGESELVVLKKILDSKKKEDVKKLNVFIDAYDKIIKELIKTAVPQELAEKHLALINNFYRLKKSIESMKKVFDDPVVGLSGISGYSNSAKSIYLIWKSIGDYFKKKNIVFEKNEPGRLFLIY